MCRAASAAEGVGVNYKMCGGCRKGRLGLQGADFQRLSQHLEKYQMLLLPALYCASEKVLERIYRFTKNGGCLLATFKTAFCNENVRVYHDCQPHKLSECFGISYQHFTKPVHVYLEGEETNASVKAEGFMECLVPAAEDTEVLLRYVHDNWGKYSAVTRHAFGKGTAYYFGCMFDKEILKKLLKRIVEENGILEEEMLNAFPVIAKSGINQAGKRICYLFDYSGKNQIAHCPRRSWRELLTPEKINEEVLSLAPWGGYTGVFCFSLLRKAEGVIL